ncbi:MAG: SGNH/GDSL hydrolase family protein [Eudoraea sp.]|nr:SGNH/GDSL hydrolase family protein [Eudoraea sp.]
MNKVKFVLLFFISIVCTSSYLPATNNDILRPKISVLFIGNSLTASNDLPQLVENTAKQKGVVIKTKMIAFPNYAIMDHWNDGKIQKEIERNHYDFVILQQGPSSQQDGREILIKFGKLYSDLCKDNDSKLVYFMVWPSLRYYHTFKDVIKNHKDAASINDAILCPVGEVWKKHFDATQNFDYYSSDGFHPSEKGSRKAADIIVEYLLKNQ